MADSSTPVPPAADADARQRIDDEHRHLNALLVELVAARDLERIESLLDALHDLLDKHFATEEADDGLHDIVARNAAHRLPSVQQLFVEHREILRRVETLRDDVAALRAGPFQRLTEQVEALAASLRAHEAVEDEIFGEAFYTDIGGRA